ncbi:MAG: thioredoxin domain-containing protein [Chloroflexi bacterium]|nr:thioredoxin domain-containing protein [Chloroflexota bacterium]
MTNRLIKETSPYLLQHAHNPVDWYPWGPEALERAKREDRPILLSVGYSACHWCHVMERESFENEEIARLMNDNFVCIKVDREERPDIDSIYMSAVQAMTGQGGWPMTVFLTPDGKPFYGGTYFPPEDRGGLPAFPRLVEALAQAYRDKPGDISRTTGQLVQRMKQVSAGLESKEPLTADIMHAAKRAIVSQFDDRHGGVGLQPKFPQPMTYEFLLRHHVRFKDPQSLEMVETTLRKMAEGGIYDQIGGGFHRYSTDTYWLVPHFEKMLYDNALLVKLYVHAYQVTGDPLYRKVVEETLDYVAREMTDPLGGFYSAQDADSEGVEGKFFVWRPEEIIEVLGKPDGELVNAHYGVTREGNFEGLSILHVAEDARSVGGRDGLSDEEFEGVLSRSRAKLLEARNGRVAPGLDDKVLASWNGLMMRAFAEAGGALGRPDYVEKANQNAKFILDSLVRDGRFLRTYRDGEAKLKGYLEDYAFVIDGLLSLHEVTLSQRWLQEAITLGHAMVDLFWDDSTSQFYDTGRDHEELLVRPRDYTDNAIPSGSSMAADVLLRLAVVTGDSEFERRAVKSLRSVRELMARFPTGAGHWLSALDFYLSTPKEVAIIGRPGEDGTDALLSQVFRGFLPNRVLVGTDGLDDEGARHAVPLLEGRDRIDGRPTAYLCENYVCNLPVTEPGALADQLLG